MRIHKLFSQIKSRYVNPQYTLQDRLFFLFGTAGMFSALFSYIAALASNLPLNASTASMVSFIIMVGLMSVSFFMQDIHINRILCAVFLNFFMFPVLFWVTGSVNCGMILYFILGMCVTTLILTGWVRGILLALSMLFYAVTIYLGFRFPAASKLLSYEQRSSDTLTSFLIVSAFIIAVILIMTNEYRREHIKVQENAARLEQEANTDNLTTLFNQRFLKNRIGDRQLHA